MHSYNELKREKEKKTAEMKEYLQQMKNLGAEFFVDGEKLEIDAAAHMVVREENRYMADFVFGEEGKVEQIRFDRVEA